MKNKILYQCTDCGKWVERTDLCNDCAKQRAKDWLLKIFK